MNQKIIPYRLVVAALGLAILALLASACKSPTDFDIPQRVDSTQVGDTVLLLASGSVFITPFTQTVAVNGFVFLHQIPLGADNPTGSVAGTFARKAGRATVGVTLNVLHDPTQSYYPTGGFIPYQAVGLTLDVGDMPADSLSIETRSANESEGAATIAVAEYDPVGKVVGVKNVPAAASITISTVQVVVSSGGFQVPMIQLQIRLTSTYVDNSSGNLFFYRVDGTVLIPWP